MNWKPSAALLAGLMVVAIGVGIVVAGGMRNGTVRVSPSPSPSSANYAPDGAGGGVSGQGGLREDVASPTPADVGASPSPDHQDLGDPSGQPSSPPEDPS